MRFLVTGTAGFIGMRIAERLLTEGHHVVGLDAVTPHYDPSLKRARLARLARFPAFINHETPLENAGALTRQVAKADAEIVVHLAAQPGVRDSLGQSRRYVTSNVEGAFNLLEAVRSSPVRHLMMASTSSVYGSGPTPFRETDRADHPLSLYAATKKATEDIAHSYSHLFSLPVTMMRFFTVYGPWGRPDMAMFAFTRAILAGEPIDVYNSAVARRDFTYVEDVVKAITSLTEKIPTPGGDSGASPIAPYRVVNIASGAPVALDDFIAAIEAAVGRRASRRELPAQPGEMARTEANVDLLRALTGFTPRTSLTSGVRAFVAWFRAYYSA